MTAWPFVAGFYFLRTTVGGLTAIAAELSAIEVATDFSIIRQGVASFSHGSRDAYPRPAAAIIVGANSLTPD